MKSVGKNDAELVASYIIGDEFALERLVMRHSKSVFNLIFSKVHNEELSNDILQEVWIKFIRISKANGYKEKGKFSGWIHRVARNAVMDHFRKQKRSKVISIDDCRHSILGITDETLNFEEETLQNQWYSDMKIAVEQLPPDQQEVIELRMTSGLSFKEIAEETVVGINTALGRMRYALMNLRKIMKIDLY